MKTALILSATFALAPLSLAQEEPVTSVHGVSPAEEQLIILSNEMEQSISLLEAISDKESADKAAPQLKTLGLCIKVRENSMLTEDFGQEQHEERIAEYMGLMYKRAALIDKFAAVNLHGSEALKDALEVTDELIDEAKDRAEEEKLHPPLKVEDIQEYISTTNEMTAILKAISDKDSADKAAAELALLSNKHKALTHIFNRVGQETVIEHIPMIFKTTILMFKTHEKLKQAQYQGSAALKAVFEGDPEEHERVFLEMLEWQEELARTLEQVTDRESADKAAPQVQALRANMDAEKAVIYFKHRDSEIGKKYLERIEKNRVESSHNSERLRAEDYYGSMALKAALGLPTPEIVELNDHLEQVNTMLKDFVAEAEPYPDEAEAVLTDALKLAEQVAHLLEGVSDKESADKAAAEIAPLRAKIEEIIPVLDELDEELVEKFFESHEKFTNKAEAIMEKLEQVNFYGSEALKSIMKD